VRTPTTWGAWTKAQVGTIPTPATWHVAHSGHLTWQRKHLVGAWVLDQSRWPALVYTKGKSLRLGTKGTLVSRYQKSRPLETSASTAAFAGGTTVITSHFRWAYIALRPKNGFVSPSSSSWWPWHHTSLLPWRDRSGRRWLRRSDRCGHGLFCLLGRKARKGCPIYPRPGRGHDRSSGPSATRSVAEMLPNTISHRSSFWKNFQNPRLWAKSTHYPWLLENLTPRPLDVLNFHSSVLFL
jgi:hypothetical protein